MENTISVVLGITNFFLMVIVSLIGFVMKNMKDRIIELEKDVKNMKDNYLSRFERVIANQNEAKDALVFEHNKTKEELLRAINSLKLDLVKEQSKNK